MTITTVDMNRINNDRVAVYLASTDRRVTIGVRFALEALGIELPDFLRRGRPGPRPNRVNKMMAALDADTGNPNTYRQEKLKICAFAPAHNPTEQETIMTNKDTLAAIATEIETLSAELLKVNNYIDILGKPAMDKANELDKALKDAKDRFATALADEQVEARNLRLSRFSDIRVEVKPGDNLNTTGFLIKYMRDTWDITANATVPKEHECNGFSALDDDAFDYLVTEKPHAIPAVIMALAPGKPREAFTLYMQGKQRGYFTTAIAA